MVLGKAKRHAIGSYSVSGRGVNEYGFLWKQEYSTMGKQEMQVPEKRKSGFFTKQGPERFKRNLSDVRK